MSGLAQADGSPNASAAGRFCADLQRLLGPLPLGQALAAAVLASVLADAAWYGAGRAFGYRVLSGLCTLSINPASCVSQTEARFVRWGLPSLVVAKFIPGFSTVAPPIAGALRMPIAGFLLAASMGALLWAGLALGCGWLARGAVPGLMAALDRNGGFAAAAVVAALGAPKHRDVVTLCACPQDAGAIDAARHLVAQGYLLARPFKGGCDAWLQEAALAGSAMTKARPERLRVFRSCPLTTPKRTHSSLQMLAIARAMAVLCA